MKFDTIAPSTGLVRLLFFCLGNDQELGYEGIVTPAWFGLPCQVDNKL